jgi:hypothetical protein
MTATSIVERLDVTEHACFGLVTGVVYAVTHRFVFDLRSALVARLSIMHIHTIVGGEAD